MKILIVSGFLGAGKTTFIKELIRRTGQDIVILENEYGDTDIDKGELSSSGDISVLELMEGCVCCTVREGFANSVLTIASALSPAFLIVEPTGAALLSRIIDNLSRITYGDISLLPPVTLVSPRSIDQSMACFGDIYADQLKAAGQIIFSKCENEDPGALRLAKEKLLKTAPSARVAAEHYSRMGEEWWLGLLGAESRPARLSKKYSYYSSKFCRRPLGYAGRQDCLALSADILGDMPLTCQAAQLPEECSFRSPAPMSVPELIMLLEDALRGRYGGIVRAKGILETGGGYVRFDLADGLYSITGADGVSTEPQCVFIGRQLRPAEIAARLADPAAFI